MGFSRDTFYRDQAARDAGGVEALFEVRRRKPNLKNRGEESTEQADRAETAADDAEAAALKAQGAARQVRGRITLVTDPAELANHFDCFFIVAPDTRDWTACSLPLVSLDNIDQAQDSLIVKREKSSYHWSGRV